MDAVTWLLHRQSYQIYTHRSCKKLLLTNPMYPVKTERYSFSFFNWEISLTFCWTKLRYLVIFRIGRYQDHFWSASLEIDCNTHICVDTENLAKTFIGKLLSEKPNQEQNQTDWKSQQCITFAKPSALVHTLLRLTFISTKELLLSNFYSKTQIRFNGFPSNSILPHFYYPTLID
jgi:hypothetical protein